MLRLVDILIRSPLSAYEGMQTPAGPPVLRCKSDAGPPGIAVIPLPVAANWKYTHPSLRLIAPIQFLISGVDRHKLG
jgi:hypothetical protein